jgi:hypothetical protein
MIQDVFYTWLFQHLTGREIRETSQVGFLESRGTCFIGVDQSVEKGETEVAREQGRWLLAFYLVPGCPISLAPLMRPQVKEVADRLCWPTAGEESVSLLVVTWPSAQVEVVVADRQGASPRRGATS